MNWHNLGTVIGFELRRTLGKPIFWLITLSAPILIIALMVVSGLSGAAAGDLGNSSDPSKLKIQYLDTSGLITPEIAATSGLTLASDQTSATAAVQSGQLDGLIVFPKNPTTETIQVIGRDQGLMKNLVFNQIATETLKAAANNKIGDPKLITLATKNPTINQTIYLPDGTISPGFLGVIVPGAFLLLFYLSVIMLGSQMMNITMEEKENRVSEMILTTMKPTTLLIGKIIAVCVISLSQLLLLSTLGGLGYLFANSGNLGLGDASIPAGALDLTGLTFAPLPILTAVLFYLGGFLLFTGALICIGAIMPTAKDASSAFAFVILAMFLPVYTWGMVVSDPHGLLSQTLTFFPLTAPITAMLRNALGSLYPWEALVSLALIFGTAVALLLLGGKLFRTGSLSYDAKLNVKKVLGLS